MRFRTLLTRVFSAILDSIGACLLSTYAIIIGPLGFLRGPLVIERAFWYIRVLAPKRLLAHSVRVLIDWRLGHFDQAIVQTESLISQLEEAYQQKGKRVMEKRVLVDLYSVLARAYLHGGHIDAAMEVVLRAQKMVGVDRLIGLSKVDPKSANLVRAALAAGRLLDGSGMATMYIKKQELLKKTDPKTPNTDLKTTPATSTTVFKGNVIPFPSKT